MFCDILQYLKLNSGCTIFQCMVYKIYYTLRCICPMDNLPVLFKYKREHLLHMLSIAKQLWYRGLVFCLFLFWFVVSICIYPSDEAHFWRTVTQTIVLVPSIHFVLKYADVHVSGLSLLLYVRRAHFSHVLHQFCLVCICFLTGKSQFSDSCENTSN